MKIGNTLIVGGGLLGTQLEQNIRALGGIPKILKDVKPNQKKLVPKDCETIIVVAQSPDYKKSTITEDLFYVNTALPIQILIQAVEAGVKNFAYCSTGSVYSNSSEPHKEDERLNYDDMAPYVITKRAAETLISSWKDKFDRLVIFRPFFMYGRRQNKQQLFPKMISNIKTGSPITLSNKKGLVFNPIHVHDASRFILSAIEHGEGLDTYNVAGFEIVSLKDVVFLIADILGKKPNVEYNNEMERCIIGSIEKMKSIGFRHEIDIKKGLKRAV